MAVIHDSSARVNCPVWLLREGAESPLTMTGWVECIRTKRLSAWINWLDSKVYLVVYLPYLTCLLARLRSFEWCKIKHFFCIFRVVDWPHYMIGFWCFRTHILPTSRVDRFCWLPWRFESTRILGLRYDCPGDILWRSKRDADVSKSFLICLFRFQLCL